MTTREYRYRRGVSVDGLRAMVEEMESQLRADERANSLMAAYERLVLRLATDLNDERDRLLSRGAALMLVHEATAGDDEGTAG